MKIKAIFFALFIYLINPHTNALLAMKKLGKTVYYKTKYFPAQQIITNIAIENFQHPKKKIEKELTTTATFFINMKQYSIKRLETTKTKNGTYEAMKPTIFESDILDPKKKKKTKNRKTINNLKEKIKTKLKQISKQKHLNIKKENYLTI